MGRKVVRIIGIIVIVLVVAFIGIQFIRPSIINHNPPVVSEPAWGSPDVRALAQRACFDCHSNETVWPWYSQIAPVSWLLARDVAEGRARFNFSDWRPGHQPPPGELSDVILEGEMPLPQYLLLHPSARLSDPDKQTLANGLAALQ